MDADPDLLGPESALAYGYHVEDCEGGHGKLLTDHRFNPLHPSFLDRIPAGTFDEGPFGDECHAYLAGFSARTLKETFDIDAEILRGIAEACRGYEEDEDELTPLVKELCRLRAPEAPPLWELPLVSASSEAEYRALIRRVQTVEPVSIEVEDIPLDALDIDRGQGMAFPPSVYTQMDQLDRSLAQGMQVTRDSLMYLAQQLEKDDCASRDCEDMLEGLVPPRGKKPRDFHLTPPATPRFAQAEPFIPDSDSAQIPSPSEPRSLLSEELGIAEATIFDQHRDEISHLESPTPGCSKGDTFTDSSSSDGPLMIEPCERRLADYKLEVPLFSSRHPEPPAIEIDFPSLRLGPLSKTVDETCDRVDRQLQEKLQQEAEKASRRVEQEQLDPLDGLVRIKVPLMDFSRPVADWSHLVGDAKAMFKHIVRSHPAGFNLPRWPVDKRAERELRWVLTASSAVVSTTEALTTEEDPNLDELFGATDDTPESALFVQKPKSLDVLRCSQDSDGDVEPRFGTPPSAQSTASVSDLAVADSDDLMKLVRKRKQALRKLKAQRPPKRARGGADARPREALLMDSRHPQSAQLLTSFLRIRGLASPEPKLTDQAVTHSAATDGSEPASDTPEADDGIQPEISPEPLVASKTDEARAAKAAEAPPGPLVNVPDFSLTLIISIDLPRGLVRALQDLLPGVEFVERDYNAHNSSIWDAGASPLGGEADITVSPATGIITATTVQVQQQTPGGCGGGNVLQRRVRCASSRYERLIVLVSDGSLDITAACPMSEADGLAFVKLQAFAAQLDTAATVSVYWVAGGEAAIARWAASFACASAAGVKLLQPLLVQDETLWELFLRRAGMNTFAAQVICGLLQDPSARDGGRVATGMPGQPGDYGLPAFLRMSAQERINRFSGVLGGRRLLDRASELIDRPWHNEGRVRTRYLS
ncbi:hypothetical protein RB595_005794 [Gaeumannomyces hyphopodioides]